MKCVCGENTVYDSFCKEHFFEDVEKRVEETIKEFNLLKKTDKVAVGVSGGKDSLTILYILKKFGYDVTGIAINEGIDGYRDPEFLHLQNFCKEHKVKLKIISFKDAFGKDLDDMNIENVGGMPCTPCGTFRRYILNSESKGFDKIATGHNMDDESQSVLMNLFKGQVEIMKRQGPITEEVEGFTVRIKPLYFIKEKEAAIYAFMKGFLEEFVECPNAKLAYRIYLRDLMNEFEKENPGLKEKLVRGFLRFKKIQKQEKIVMNKCSDCEEPSSREVCKACQIKVKI